MAKKNQKTQKRGASKAKQRKINKKNKIDAWAKMLAYEVNQEAGFTGFDHMKQVLMARTNKAFKGEDSVFLQVIDEAVISGYLQYDDMSGNLYTKYKKTLAIYFKEKLRKTSTLEGLAIGGAVFPTGVVSEFKDNMLKIDCGWAIEYGLDGFLVVTAKRMVMTIRPDMIDKLVVE